MRNKNFINMPTRENLTEKEKEVMDLAETYAKKTGKDIEDIPERFNIDFDKLSNSDVNTLNRIKEMKETLNNI